MSVPKKAIILTAGDTLIDFDAAYLDVLPKLFKNIFEDHIGKNLNGINIKIPDEEMIRDIYYNRKPLHFILESCFEQMRKKTTPHSFIDSSNVLALALGIGENQINSVELTEEEKEHALKYIELEIFDNDIDQALYPTEREQLIDKKLQDYQKDMDTNIKAHLNKNGPFIPETMETLNRLIEMCFQFEVRRVTVSMVFDLRSGVNDYRTPHEVFYNQDISLACD